MREKIANLREKSANLREKSANLREKMDSSLHAPSNTTNKYTQPPSP